MILLAALLGGFVGIVVGLLLAEFYPRRGDTAFKEYLRTEYETGKKPQD